jgi:Sec-independent protein translocase protein TatA
MFGFSLAELIIVFLVIIIFIKPADLPEVAHFLGKIFYRLKRFYNELKSSVKDLEKEFGVEDLKQEMQRGIAEEKAKLEEDFTIIVDMEGNEHRVPNVHEIRPDLSREDLEKEIEQENQKNKSKEK